MKTNSRFFFLKSSFNLTSIWKKKWEKKKYQIKRFGRSWTNKTKLIRWKFLIFNWSGPEGGIGIFSFGYFLDRFFDFSVFRFWCSLRFADFPFLSSWFSVIAKNTNGFSDLISDAVFGFSYLTYLGSGFSSILAAITRLHWLRIAAKRKCYQEECVTNNLNIAEIPR